VNNSLATVVNPNGTIGFTTFPTLSGLRVNPIDDISGIVMYIRDNYSANNYIHARDGILYYNNDQIAQAADISGLADWAFEPALHNVDMGGNDLLLNGVGDISGARHIVAQTITTTNLNVLSHEMVNIDDVSGLNVTQAHIRTLVVGTTNNTVLPLSPNVMTVVGGLGVSGPITAGAGLTVTTGGLSVTGGANITNLLTANTGISVTGGLTVTGGANITNLLTANTGISVTGGLTVTGGANITNLLTANTGISVTGGLTVTTGGLSVSAGSLSASGTITGGSIVATGAGTISSGTGAISTGGAIVGGSLATGGTIMATNNGTISTGGQLIGGSLSLTSAPGFGNPSLYLYIPMTTGTIYSNFGNPYYTFNINTGIALFGNLNFQTPEGIIGTYACTYNGITYNGSTTAGVTGNNGTSLDNSNIRTALRYILSCGSIQIRGSFFAYNNDNNNAAGFELSYNTNNFGNGRDRLFVTPNQSVIRSGSRAYQNSNLNALLIRTINYNQDSTTINYSINVNNRILGLGYISVQLQGIP